MSGRRSKALRRRASAHVLQMERQPELLAWANDTPEQRWNAIYKFLKRRWQYRGPLGRRLP